MKIALVGATGHVGTRLRQVSVSPVSADVQNEKVLAAVLAGHDVVIHSVKFLSTNASKIIAARRRKCHGCSWSGRWKSGSLPRTYSCEHPRLSRRVQALRRSPAWSS